MALLDDIDIALLKMLQQNSRVTTKDLSMAVGLSQTPVYERVKRLEAEGYITNYVALLDADKLHLGFSVYCNVKLARQTTEAAFRFMETIKEIPEVTECYSMAGSTDYLLKIHAPDMAYYRRFVLETLGSIPEIGSIESQFVMSTVKFSTALPIEKSDKRRIKKGNL